MPTSGTVGERFQLNITATVPDLSHLEVLPLFDIQTSWTAVAGPAITDAEVGQEHERTFSYIIVPFETGRQSVPQVALTYAPDGRASSTVHSKPLWVEVNSVLSGNGSASALRDVKPPVALPVPPAVIWTGAILIFALAALLAWWLWRRYSQRFKKLLGRSLTPPEVALKEMSALESERLIEHKKIKEFYTRLSDSTRNYLQAAYNVHALDLTTNELHRALDELAEDQPQNHTDDYRKALALLIEMLDEADLVKFARFMPEASRCRRALQAGRDIVMLTRYKFETEEEAATASNEKSVPPRPPAPPMQRIVPPHVPSESSR